MIALSFCASLGERDVCAAGEEAPQPTTQWPPLSRGARANSLISKFPTVCLMASFADPEPCEVTVSNAGVAQVQHVHDGKSA